METHGSENCRICGSATQLKWPSNLEENLSSESFAITDAHYGLGWRVYQLGETRIAYHSGWVSGYRADIAYSPSHGIGVTVLMNAESSSISLLTTRFWELAEQRFKLEPIAP